jgi:hypothetical protein
VNKKDKRLFEVEKNRTKKFSKNSASKKEGKKLKNSIFPDFWK